MPEYLAPGVYVEEVSFRSKSIEGVSTSTAGFVGPALFGPTSGPPVLVTSFAEFERIYGSLDQLKFEDQGAKSHNYLAHGVRAFFENNGQRVYIARIYEGPEQYATARIGDPTVVSPPGSSGIELSARYPGGNTEPDLRIEVIFGVKVSKNVLAGSDDDPALRGVKQYDLVWIQDNAGAREGVYWAERYFNTSVSPNQWTWKFHPASGSDIELSSLDPDVDVVKIVSVGVQVHFPGAFPRSVVFQNLTFHPEHPDSMSKFFAKELQNRSMELNVPLVFDPLKQLTNGAEIARIMLSQPRSAAELKRLRKLLGGSPPMTDNELTILATLGSDKLAETDRMLVMSLGSLQSGSDGQRPRPDSYEGRELTAKLKTGLKALEDVSDISIIAAPGYSAQNDANKIAISGLLISHCERMRYRIAVLDSVDGQGLNEVREYRAQLDSKYAAFYYPWVRIMDPVTDEEINLPPSGFVCGLYADNDVLYGVHKAPANMVVQLAIGFEVLLNKAQQDVLNPEGINCFRFFEGRGYRLWGARTISSDPEWKYVNLRRYFAYLERSIDVGTQWVVFENNSEPLWGNVQRTVEDFLFNEWKSNHLMGAKPEQAYFVRCDRSTMTQNDFDNGRLICLVGVSPVRPAEFVIFRIGQWVAGQS